MSHTEVFLSESSLYAPGNGPPSPSLQSSLIQRTDTLARSAAVDAEMAWGGRFFITPLYSKFRTFVNLNFQEDTIAAKSTNPTKTNQPTGGFMMRLIIFLALALSACAPAATPMLLAWHNEPATELTERVEWARTALGYPDSVWKCGQVLVCMQSDGTRAALTDV